MADFEIIPEAMKARMAQIGRADLVIALPVSESSEALGAAASRTGEALRALSPDLTAVFVHSNGLPEAFGTPALDGRLQLIQLPHPPESDPLRSAGRSASRLRRTLFAAGMMLEARACGVVETDPLKMTAANLSRLFEPILSGGQDLVMAAYWRRKYDNLLNTAIVYPLLRALYGKRVQWPMAPDFGVSPACSNTFSLRRRRWRARLVRFPRHGLRPARSAAALRFARPTFRRGWKRRPRTI